MKNPFAKSADDADADELDGLSPTDCPYECSPERCCVTGINVCGHPNKGGLQAASLQQPAVLRRFNEARRLLAHGKVASHEDAVRRATEGPNAA